MGSYRRGTMRGPRAATAALCALASLALATTAAVASDDGWSQIAPQCEAREDAVSGSSNPTFFSSNHRMVATDRGRIIAVYDGHGSGQQIRWRDPGREWQSRTTGATEDGYLAESLPNDRAASLAIGRDSSGEEHAWMVWSGYAEELGSPVEMRRLSDLDASSGPFVGPAVTIEAFGTNMRVDAAIQGRRGAVAWTRRTDSGNYELMAAWFDLDTSELEDRAVLYSGPSSEATATLVPTPAGMRAVAGTNGRLQVWSHDAGSSWTRGSAAAGVSPAARPSAIAMRSGDILAAAQGDSTTPSVEVVSFAANADDASTVLRASGYVEPTIAGDGSRAWVVMVDRSRNELVSRALSGGEWSKEDRIETTGMGGGLAWPNALRDAADGKLRVLVDGADCASKANRNPVLYFQRSTEPASPAATLSVGDVRVSEGNRGTVWARSRVSLSATSSEPVSIDYETLNGTAAAGSDYRGARGTLLFAPGTRTRSVGVAVQGDRADEADERFFVRLLNPQGAGLSMGRGRVTIADDDPSRTRTTVSVGRRARVVNLTGTVRPAASGRRVNVTLLRKQNGRFVALDMRRPRLAAYRDGASVYETSFRRPRPGACKVVARFARRGDLLGSKAVKFFSC